METKIHIPESLKLHGRIFLREFPAGILRRMIDRAKTEFEKKQVFNFIRQGKIAAATDNLIMTAPNVGRDILIQWLLGNSNYTQTGSGSAVLDGINTYPWATYDGISTYTLTSSVVLQNLTIAAGINLNSGGSYTVTVTGQQIPIGINYGAIGTSQTAVTSTDTQLGAETNRSPVLYSQDSANNEAIVQFFFPDGSITNQTYYEAGGFINATSSANSGQIFNHALFGSPYTKTSGSDLTLELDININ